VRRAFKYYRIMWLKYDLAAGLSVFLVALPLCLGIALASGAPLYAGLLSGIIGGMVVALISGSHLSVSGPAAGLTTLVASAIVSLGDYKIFLLSVMVAGFVQILIGLLKLGTIASYVPSSVIKGMLAAIGIILVSKQIPLLIGYDRPDFWTNAIIKLFSTANFKEILARVSDNFKLAAVLISLVSLGLLYLFQQPFARKIKYIPAPLMVVIIGIIANVVISSVYPEYALSETQVVHIPPDLFAEISFPDFSKLFSDVEIWSTGLIIGLLATLETLLCVEAVDKIDRQNRITPINREMVAQGIGNMTCGLLGAIPLTAVVVRGAANVDAGAHTKLSAFTHGLFLLLSVLFIPFLLNQIPYASLAAILIVTGYNLTKPKLFRNMWKLGAKQFIPFITTISVILLTDLLIGVCVGLLISVYFIIQNNFRAQYHITRSREQDVDSFYIKLNRDVSFLNKVELKKTLDEVPKNSVLTIDGSECDFIDYDILEVISEFRNKAAEKRIALRLKGIEIVNVDAIH